MSGQITCDYWLNISLKYERLKFEIVEDIFIVKLHKPGELLEFEIVGDIFIIKLRKRSNPASSSIDPSVSGILRETSGVASISLSFELDLNFDSDLYDI